MSNSIIFVFVQRKLLYEDKFKISAESFHFGRGIGETERI